MAATVAAQPPIPTTSAAQARASRRQAAKFAQEALLEAAYRRISQLESLLEETRRADKNSGLLARLRPFRFSTSRPGRCGPRRPAHCQPLAQGGRRSDTETFMTASLEAEKVPVEYVDELSGASRDESAATVSRSAPMAAVFPILPLSPLYFDDEPEALPSGSLGTQPTMPAHDGRAAAEGVGDPCAPDPPPGEGWRELALPQSPGGRGLAPPDVLSLGVPDDVAPDPPPGVGWRELASPRPHGGRDIAPPIDAPQEVEQGWRELALPQSPGGCGLAPPDVLPLGVSDVAPDPPPGVGWRELASPRPHGGRDVAPPTDAPQKVEHESAPPSTDFPRVSTCAAPRRDGADGRDPSPPRSPGERDFAPSVALPPWAREKRELLLWFCLGGFSNWASGVLCRSSYCPMPARPPETQLLHAVEPPRLPALAAATGAAPAAPAAASVVPPSSTPSTPDRSHTPSALGCTRELLAAAVAAKRGVTPSPSNLATIVSEFTRSGSTAQRRKPSPGACRVDDDGSDEPPFDIFADQLP